MMYGDIWTYIVSPLVRLSTAIRSQKRTKITRSQEKGEGGGDDVGLGSAILEQPITHGREIEREELDSERGGC